MKPPINPTYEEANNDAQGKVFNTVAPQETAEGVYAPPPVPNAAALQAAAMHKNDFHMVMMGYGPAPGFVSIAEQQRLALFRTQMEQQMQANTAGTVSPAATWECKCGTENTGRFCTNCGLPQEWVCACGAKNTGRFCPECGQKRS